MTQGEDVRQQDAYKGVLAQEGRGKRELEKTAYWGALWSVTLTQYDCGYQINKNLTGREHNKCGGEKKIHKGLLFRHLNDRSLGRFRVR